jgi:BexC/CtrB/KpsE family polysaccharide export inner-membrane protein
LNDTPVLKDELVGETRANPIPAVNGEAKSRRPFFASRLFLATVVVPTVLAGLYFGVFASDVYISEARFVVRSPARQANSPLGIILNGGGFAGAGEEASAVLEYVRSRDALDQTDADQFVTKAFSAPAISWFDRFGTVLRGETREHLFDYYLRKVSIENDSALQVTRLSVSAFTAEDAREINRRLLRQAESLVNRLSERARDDAIRIAAKEVRDAQGNARSAALALSRFRGREGILDPGQEAGIRLQMVSKLQDQLVAARTQLQQLLTFTPQATQIPFLRSRIQSLEREIAEQTGSIAGGQTSLSSAVVKYQQLRLENDLAEKQLAAAFGALEEARAEARRKRAYVERISEPSLPDYAREPRRIRSVLAVFILGLLLWGVLSALVAGVREHQD